MKRYVAALLAVVCVLASADAKQTRSRSSHAKSKKPYCAGVKGITDCADEGCGPNSQPELNKRKNIRSDNPQAIAQTISWMNSLLDPENFTHTTQDAPE